MHTYTPKQIDIHIHIVATNRSSMLSYGHFLHRMNKDHESDHK